ncbi:MULTISPECIES: two-partner secretion domain-containing protein [Nostocales]|uniref:Filamentous hemagglutinin N-terminal domain-containing protein n=1 Tax=Tolypothrix bouteillei VB521301 TaxID=1479485 RepID=A0A8S9TEQ0_9CYAN|nr:filamentous hemagglutinin N-terminal domain-containing protein [Tolypothrix bouteillei]KAF3889793.1 filamentous hemagglutinin N-terminal domain-containing protein [Tolypothrix bouteillei VB521301]
MKAASVRLSCVKRIITTGVLLPLGIMFPDIRYVNAQVSSDGTLNTSVSQSGDRFIITNGSATGSNLFHSFRQFSVPTGGSATFDLANTPNISTIFSRVTSGSISQIDGLIETINGNRPVSLFLINPSGIVFGANAKLNISGSFIGTTATSIQFADGVELKATEAMTPPILTVSVPIGLQFGPNSGAISVQNASPSLSESSSGIGVMPGKTLALLGNGIDLAGGILKTVDGSIELGSVRSGQVNLQEASVGWAFDYSNVGEGLSDLHLSEQAQVSGLGFGSSAIQMHGRNISIVEGSAVTTQNLGSRSSDRIAIHATELFSLEGTNPQGTIRSQVASSALGLGKGGDISVLTRQLLLRGGAQIATQSVSSGQGGNILVRAVEFISANGLNPVNPLESTSIATTSAGSGKAGNVTVSTQKLMVANGAGIGSLTSSTADSGDVQIDASDSIDVSGINNITFLPTFVASSTIGYGSAGNLSISTAQLTVRDGGLVSSLTSAIGNAGNVKIIASDFIDVNGASPNNFVHSSIGSSAIRLESIDPVTRATYNLPEIPNGNAGGVVLVTPQLRVKDGSEVGVRNDGTGNAGNFEIYADSIVLNNRGGISAATQSGTGGNLLLNARQLLLIDGNSKISVEAKGTGDGGNIAINAPVVVGFNNSDIVANAIQGRGGNIQITTQGIFGLKFHPQLTSENDITASSQSGVSGTVQINTIGIAPNIAVVELPANVVDPSQQIATGCAGSQSNRFVATGRGGIPQNPNQQAISDRTWDDTRDLSAYQKTRDVVVQTPLSPELLVEATTWHRNTKGELELIAPPSLGGEQQLLTCADIVKQH